MGALALVSGTGEDGTFWTATSGNAAIDTGIASAIQSAFSATAGLVSLKNNDSATALSNKRVVPSYIRLINTVVPASATRSELIVAVDNQTRYSSGGSQLTPANVNMMSAQSTIALCHFGALVFVAESGSVRRIARAQLRAAIPVQFEEYLIVFLDPQSSNFQTLGGTTAQRQVVHVPPAVLGPGHALTVHVWHPGNAATPASWEVEMGWLER